jgi:hypothetical protein
MILNESYRRAITRRVFDVLRTSMRQTAFVLGGAKQETGKSDY